MLLISGFSAKNIGEEVAVSHHYRLCDAHACDAAHGLQCTQLPTKIDRIAHRWARHLFTRVNEICDHTFGKEKGCPEATAIHKSNPFEI